MRMGKEYRNAIRSRKLIRNAFCELIYEKQDFSVTVKEIVERADVSKSTFYAHYSDISALINEISDELLNNLKSLVEIYEGNKTDPIIQVNSFFDSIKEHDLEYRRLLVIDYPSRFMTKFRKLIKEIEAKYPNMRLIDSDNRDENHAYISFYIMGLMELLISYFHNDTSLTLDEIKDIVIDIYNKLCK